MTRLSKVKQNIHKENRGKGREENVGNGVERPHTTTSVRLLDLRFNCLLYRSDSECSDKQVRMSSGHRRRVCRCFFWVRHQHLDSKHLVHLLQLRLCRRYVKAKEQKFQNILNKTVVLRPKQNAKTAVKRFICFSQSHSVRVRCMRVMS